MMNMVELDKEYELRMVEAEVDCADGKGSAQACHQLGEYFAVIKHEYERAAQIFELNCETKNHSPSCFSLARFYELGKGVTSDFDKATKLFDRACDQKHPAACQTMGTILRMRKWGDGEPATPEMVAQFELDKAKSLACWNTACKMGNFESCFLAASVHLQQHNPDRQPVEAMNKLKFACKDGNHVKACHNLAVMYRVGDQGVPADAKKFEYYKAKTEELAKHMGGM